MTDCECKTFTTHTTHGDPWCRCGHQYGRHAASGACTYTDEPTYTASEVKVLTETASKVAYALGRKDAGEEIAAAIERRRGNTAHRIPWEAFTDAANTARQVVADPRPVRIRREPCDTHCPCICHDGWGGAHPNQDCRDANATSQPSQAASDATSGVPGHQEVSEAVRSPQEPGEGS